MIVSLWRLTRPIVFGALGVACLLGFALGMEALDDIFRGGR